MNSCPLMAHCWMRIALCLAWLLISSGLLFLTWNKVVVAMTKMKPAKYWQALLLLVTLCFLICPFRMMHSRGHCHDGSCEKSGHHSAESEEQKK